MMFRRPRQLSEGLIDQVELLARQRLSDSSIAARLGITPSTLKRWLRLGESNDPLDHANGLYVRFNLAYNMGRSVLEEELTKKASPEFMLKAVFQQTYNPKPSDLADERMELVIEHLADTLPDDVFDQVLSALESEYEREALPPQAKAEEKRGQAIDITVIDS